MLADRTYEEVATHWPDLDESRMRNPRDLCALLEAVTDIEWRLSPCWYPQPRVDQFVAPKWPVAVWIQDAVFATQFAQWIVINGDTIHDPGEWTAHPVSTYPLCHWLVTLVAQPARGCRDFAAPTQRR